MITVHQPISCTSVPTLGSLTGSYSPAAWVKDINDALATNGGGGTQFAQYLSQDSQHQFTSFYNNVLAPRLETNDNVVNGLKDRGIAPSRYICSVEDLESGVPVGMQAGVMHDPRLRAMYERGEVYGFDLDPSEFAETDVYAERHDAGAVTIDDDLLSVVENKDDVLYYRGTEEPVQWATVYDSTHPDMEWDTLDDIMATREYFHSILDTSRFDPTNYPSKRRKVKKS